MDEKEKQLRAELKALLISAQESGSPKAEGRKAALGQRRQLEAAFADWQKRYQEWIETEGAKYGVGFRESEPAGAPGEEK